ncbi:putative metal-dependent hydrolase [Bifidobacterium actinocoloniiforme DSM 22766]|uniref:Putative metal-dependent hydrolase n=1 Tax=Bifidobacterium actinocoloniiforme DSM 22766 TaxID=1437605 RepID=A0A086YWB8_9BIFI|nr:SprT family zinc-dependent metalloprotease [Bifidobacterium actinocoloniiforme]AKV55775.1 hypothetical protein AB656_05910 [Bifidobacterium actinocoloniiforme DSM 22766]KFI38568.1 putative metal-dependent hydrolase [Bifidobacterium actinocoloniiforme DSM 22766]
MPLTPDQSRPRRGGRGEFSRRWIDVDGQRALLIRKRVKNVYLRVKPPEGRIEVTAPARLPEAEIRRFVSSRMAWVEGARERIARSRRALGGGSGAVASRAEGSERERPAARGEHDEQERLRQARGILSGQLPGLLDRWVPVVGRGPTSITLRRMTTRWGSCTPASGRIRLNLELAWLEPRFLEYVLVHELTHLRASGHGARFQGLMDSYLPGWREVRRELNRYVIV